MYWKTVELKNFQKHEQLKVDLAPGLTTVYGPGRAGKSCLLRAIRWVLSNEPGGDCVRKTGTKTTEVWITRDDGLKIGRRKGDGANDYIIEALGTEAKEFNSINKTIPNEVKELIGMVPLCIDDEEIYLNFARQMDMPFLFDKAPSFVMKVFSTVAQTEILGKVFKSLNTDILQTQRQDKAAIEELKSLESQEEVLLRAVEKSDKILAALKPVYDNLLEDEKKIANYETLRGALDQAFRDIEMAEDIIAKTPVAPDLTDVRVAITKHDQLTSLIKLYNSAQGIVGQYTKDVAKPVPIDLLADLGTVKELTVYLKKLEDLLGQYEAIDLDGLVEDMLGYDPKLEELNGKRAEIIKKCPSVNCPKCQTVIDYDVIRKVI